MTPDALPQRVRCSDETLQGMQRELAGSTVPMLRELAASLAHELNQPLAAIVANCDASLRWLRTVPPNLEQIGRAGERIRRDALRASAAFEQAETLRTPEPEQRLVYLGESVQEVMDMLASELQRHEVQTQVLISPNLPPIIGTRIELQHVFANLIANAIESLAHVEVNARRLSIQCMRDRQPYGEVLSVVVQDSGHGLAGIEQEPPFDALVTARSGVLGIGLAVSRSIVRRHGGELHSRNTPAGRRLEFCVPVPAQSQAWRQPT